MKEEIITTAGKLGLYKAVKDIHERQYLEKTYLVFENERHK